MTIYSAAYTAERPFHTALLAELDSAGSAFRHITPNWFASVMGTGIVATAAATLPLHVPGLARIRHCGMDSRRHRAGGARPRPSPRTGSGTASRRKPMPRISVVGQFYGAPAMALLTVGAGALLLGPAIIGRSAALALDVVLWTAGTVLGLVVALWLPFAMITREDHTDVEAVPAWMMPVVSPMVSASTGALLLSTSARDRPG